MLAYGVAAPIGLVGSIGCFELVYLDFGATGEDPPAALNIAAATLGETT